MHCRNIFLSHSGPRAGWALLFCRFWALTLTRMSIVSTQNFSFFLLLTALQFDFLSSVVFIPKPENFSKPNCNGISRDRNVAGFRTGLTYNVSRTGSSDNSTRALKCERAPQEFIPLSLHSDHTLHRL
ncbi:hypothetical protein SCHPADRAFT_588922 [Schizopora paradoxa]|uniref:Uncharacterized protein n=1 Tax=Schizopora paradoxa TaxID=27342 RepID=A0A0H2RBW5_9AGAM|nr:hypothetical protein SCHPADRAFT_588922 [Schizopora paradoxa]